MPTKQSLVHQSANPITAYHYGTGDKEILFVGGIHGGYEWNTALVAYQLMDYLKANPNVIPKNVKVTVIPVLNPDGLIKLSVRPIVLHRLMFHI
jgi:murein tripeptide amidase MpaA